ncbi:uncharacterized protein LOC108673864 [Hyalella azteca]|uniref:Uncharacterized protein LOC108673864 n=1 Tax=Hyalella azteca TaxID=294128 RepID=A0A8B7NU35_HYAAZ|nr:uncharacterized protein LOC108673864 [Hyalella azteca]
MVASGLGRSPCFGNVTVVHICRSDVNLSNYGNDDDDWFYKSDQYDVPVRLDNIELEKYLKNQGCVILRSAHESDEINPLNGHGFPDYSKLKRRHCSNTTIKNKHMSKIECEVNDENTNEKSNRNSDDKFVQSKRSIATGSDWKNNEDIVTEQIAKIILRRRESIRIHRNNVTVNKGAIADQNVGVSGEVLMVTPGNSSYAIPEKAEEAISRHSPTVVYIGTVEELGSPLKSVDVVEMIEAIESGPSSLTLSYYEPQSSEKTDQLSELMSEGVSKARINSLQHEEKPLTSPALLLQWRVRPPDEELRSAENASPVTPSSSMFSSAYTVTELGSDNNSDRSPPSEYSQSTMSSRRISEADDAARREDERNFRFHEYLQLFRQLNSFNQALGMREAEGLSPEDSMNGLDINNFSRQGSNRSVVFDYVPSKDQREREEEELWVANEATYSSNITSSVTSPTYQPVILGAPAVNLIINESLCGSIEDKNGSTLSSRSSTMLGSSVNMTSTATQTIYSCLLPPSNFYSVQKRCDRRKNVSQTAGADACAASVVESGSTCEDVDAHEQMAALICPVGGVERRHFSARQQYSENETKKDANFENERNLTCVKTKSDSLISDKNKTSICSVTSAATHQPTKRFSFLIRSNSIEQREIVNLNTSVSASDRAILARLAELKVNEFKETPYEKKVSSSLHPPCLRCHEPVYPQERLQPSKEMLFHVSCFRCCQCGVKLNLKTFYRNPVTLKDYRIFCKSHVPTLDPGKVAQEKKAQSAPTSATSASCCSSAATVASNGSAYPATERVVVKCDTQGLRYF